jgi:dGTPase
MLERLRFPLAASRGRRYPEAPHPYRNDFQRDRDRIIHARAFRRLERKTQVFSEPVSDHFRNRLTHTIEVAQIARTVAARLGLDEDLTEALALAHDFGHPPFAHAGETELNRQMARFGERFDHNLHALRLVESFEQRYARFPGLNLTFEVREGMAKHSRDFAAGEFPELEEYLPGLRPPLEAQLIDLADEVAYNTADLDDAVDAGILTIEDITARVERYAEIHEAIETQFPGAPPRIQFLEGLRLLIDSLVTGLIEGTVEAAREAGVGTVEEVRAYPQRLARFRRDAAATGRELKRLLYERVYNSAPLRQERERSMGCVAALFDCLLADPSKMPEPYAGLASEQPPHRVVCDYIAGMTDGFLMKTVRQLGLDI